jgi:hypothetical protein
MLTGVKISAAGYVLAKEVGSTLGALERAVEKDQKDFQQRCAVKQREAVIESGLEQAIQGLYDCIQHREYTEEFLVKIGVPAEIYKQCIDDHRPVSRQYRNRDQYHARLIKRTNALHKAVEAYNARLPEVNESIAVDYKKHLEVVKKCNVHYTAIYEAASRTAVDPIILGCEETMEKMRIIRNTFQSAELVVLQQVLLSPEGVENFASEHASHLSFNSETWYGRMWKYLTFA